MASSDESLRTQAIASALASAEQNPDAERIQLPWRGSNVKATVVKIPVDAVVLNPRSHRIRAQLESSPQADLVKSAPFDPRAQEVITWILRITDKFDDLKTNLRDVGQTDPGVVTHTGLLVNANTRCVALRDINAGHIRVAVLPSDASDEDVDRLELNLQMVRDFRREYTFTNELLFIEELVTKYRYSSLQIAIEMNWVSRSDATAAKRAEEEVQTRLRMLALVRELQALSGNRLRLVDFDAARQAINELDEDCEAIKHQNPEGARQIRDMRLAAWLSGAGYRDLREINEGFLEKYLIPALEEQSLFQGNVENIVRPLGPKNTEILAGLDVLEDQADVHANTKTAETLLTLLAESYGGDVVMVPGNADAKIEINRGNFIEELKQAVESAAEDVRLDRQQGDLVDRPRSFVRKASKQLRNAMEAFQQARGNPQFDADKFLAAVAEHSTAQEALQSLIGDE
jgi:hypothetical protein